MKSLLIFLGVSSVFHPAAAMEPSVVLVTAKEKLVYQVSDGRIELRERLSHRAAHRDTQEARPFEAYNSSGRLQGSHDVAAGLDLTAGYLAAPE